MRAALALPALPDIARCHALYVCGALATRQGDHESAMTMLTECLALRRSLATRVRPPTLSAGAGALATGRRGKGARMRRGVARTFRQLGEQLGEATGLIHLGEICTQLGDDAEARAHFEQALVLSRSIKHLEMESESERYLGELALAAADLPGAHARFTRSLQICRDAEDKRDEAIALWCLGKTETASGDHVTARSRLVDALRAFKELEMRAEALDCLEDCAVLSLAVGQPDRAVQLLAARGASRFRGHPAVRQSGKRTSTWHARLCAGPSSTPRGQRAAPGRWTRRSARYLHRLQRRPLLHNWRRLGNRQSVSAPFDGAPATRRRAHRLSGRAGRARAPPQRLRSSPD